MEHTLLSLALLLIVAKLMEGLALRIRQSAVAAYVATGILLGPVLHVVEADSELSLFLSVGIIFLFFLIGADEIDVPGFFATLHGRFFLASAIAFVIPLGTALAVTYYVVHMPLSNAIAVAGLIALSSLGIAAKVLSDLGHLKEPLGLEIFTTVVIVELLGLLVVGFTLHEAESPGVFRAWDIPKLLGQIVGFALVSWVLASRIFPPLVIRLRRLLGSPHLTFGLLVGALFLIAFGAERIGLHGSLGALLLGIALSGLQHRLRSEVMPGLRSLGQGLFIPLFFASSGLYLDLSFTALPIWTIVGLVLVTVLGKFAGSALASYVAQAGAPFAIGSGLMAKGVIEVALLLVMLEADIITQELFSLLTIIMLGFMLVMPSVIGLGVSQARVKEKAALPRAVPPSFGRYALDNVRVGDILDKGRQFPSVSLSINDFAEQWMVPDQQDYVVVEQEGQLAGVLSLRKLQRVRKDQWDKTLIGSLIKRRVPRADPSDPVADVLERMAERSITVVPVIDPKTRTLIGSVSNRDVFALILGESSQ